MKKVFLFCFVTSLFFCFQGKASGKKKMQSMVSEFDKLSKTYRQKLTEREPFKEESDFIPEENFQENQTRKTKKKMYDPVQDGWMKRWLRRGCRTVIGKDAGDFVVDGSHKVVETGGVSLAYISLATLALSKFKKIPFMGWRNPLYKCREEVKKWTTVGGCAGGMVLVYHLQQNKDKAAKHREEIDKRAEAREKKATEHRDQIEKRARTRAKDSELKLFAAIEQQRDISLEGFGAVQKSVFDVKNEVKKVDEGLMNLTKIVGKDNAEAHKLLEELKENQNRFSVQLNDIGSIAKRVEKRLDIVGQDVKKVGSGVAKVGDQVMEHRAFNQGSSDALSEYIRKQNSFNAENSRKMDFIIDKVDVNELD